MRKTGKIKLPPPKGAPKPKVGGKRKKFAKGLAARGSD
jgi:hypothetical protein